MLAGRWGGARSGQCAMRRSLLGSSFCRVVVCRPCMHWKAVPAKSACNARTAASTQLDTLVLASCLNSCCCVGHTSALPSEQPRALRHPPTACPSSPQNPESEAARRKAETDRLRAAEKFMKVGTGEAECKGCGYVYSPSKGDPEYPIAPGMKFEVCAAGPWQQHGAAVPKPRGFLCPWMGGKMQSAARVMAPTHPAATAGALQNLPEDWQCPVCGAEKRVFSSLSKTVAGFAENQVCRD